MPKGEDGVKGEAERRIAQNLESGHVAVSCFASEQLSLESQETMIISFHGFTGWGEGSGKKLKRAGADFFKKNDVAQ